MDRHYLTKVVRNLQRSLRSEQSRSARDRQQYEECIRALKRIREEDHRLYCQVQNLYEKECKHSGEMFKQVVDYQARLTFYRSVTFALIVAVGSSLVFNYFNP